MDSRTPFMSLRLEPINTPDPFVKIKKVIEQYRNREIDDREDYQKRQLQNIHEAIQYGVQYGVTYKMLKEVLGEYEDGLLDEAINHPPQTKAENHHKIKAEIQKEKEESILLKNKQELILIANNLRAMLTNYNFFTLFKNNHQPNNNAASDPAQPRSPLHSDITDISVRLKNAEHSLMGKISEYHTAGGNVDDVREIPLGSLLKWKMSV